VTKFEAAVTELLTNGHGVRFVATGDSMYPSIRSGEHVHVAPANAASLRVGDVVLARAHRGLTAHRVVQVALNTITTRGDNALERDAALSHKDVLGRITLVERGGSQIAVPSAPARFRVAARRVARIVLSL
jgi:phage repressor protein C with HTH and peptisase S24 domain